MIELPVQISRGSKKKPNSSMVNRIKSEASLSRSAMTLTSTPTTVASNWPRLFWT